MSNNTQIVTAPEEVTDIQIQRENAAFAMLQRQANMFASSSLVPKDFQGNIANCAIGINIAKRLGADPFMVLQNIDIIHGRPSFRATFLIAMVNAAGRFAPLQFRMEGDEGKPSRACVAWTTDKDSKAVLEGPKITLEMAKAEGWSTKNGSKWLTMPELMLRYRAAAFFARLYAPDITLGMQTAEEVQDMGPPRDVTPSAAASKLFTQPALEQKAESAPSILRSSPDITISDLIAESDTTWTDIRQTLLDNGVISDAYASSNECTPEEAQIIARDWNNIIKLVKAA